MKYLWFSHFSGCGGSTIGALQSNFTPQLAIENDELIADLYQKNINSNILIKDICSIQISDIAPIVPSPNERARNNQILVMQTSPPCQEFSQANMKRDTSSHRADILKDTIWQYALLHPEYVILENVKAYKDSKALKEFESFLLSMGYAIYKKILNSADFGVPQTRERLILIAAKNGYPMLQIIPTHAKSPSNQLSLFEQPKQQWVGWYEAINDLIPELGIVAASKAERERNIPDGALIERVGWFDAPKFRYPPDPCWTLRASLADDGKTGRSKVIDIYHKEVVRTLNIQALARLQSFPDWYQWGESFKINMRGIGNSVPPLLMKHICDAVKTACE